MTEINMETLLQAVKRVERKLDIVIRAIYEHDEDIHDEYGRSQRTIDAGLARAAEEVDGGILGYDESESREEEDRDANESSIAECDVSDVPRVREERREPIANRSSKREANPARGNGKVQGKESISRGNREDKNVSREDGVRQHASSQSRSAGRGYRGGKGKGSSNGKASGSNQEHKGR